MAGSILTGLSAVVLPKGRGQKGGRASTPGFNPQQSVMTLPTYRDHLTDVYSSRVANDSRTLLATLANMDPDVSSAINAYLSVAGSSEPQIVAVNPEGEMDPEGIKLGRQIMALMTTTNDYTVGYSNKPTTNSLCNAHRYMMLLRGGTALELVLDKTYVPSELRTVDPATLTWEQTAPGVYKPTQTPTGTNTKIDLNIPTFFTSSFHQSPLDMYTFSPFVSSINTIASRQLVINELYRIMKIVGYPRVDVKVLEDVVAKAAPPAYRSNPEQLRAFMEAELNRVRQTIANLQSSDAFVHTSAIETSIINDKNPSAGLQIQGVIDVLNAQNQAALKVMPAVVGKSDNGQVASTEARLFALNADALNRAVADILSQAVTLAARLTGYAGRIIVFFPPVELRPDLELEPQRTMRASRLKEDLSLGIITDDEYTMAMYGRSANNKAPELSGTGFAEPQPVGIDTSAVSPNSDSLGRSLTGEGGNGVGRNNAAKSGNAKQKTKLIWRNEDGYEVELAG
jgi:hypothetical protein